MTERLTLPLGVHRIDADAIIAGKIPHVKVEF